MLMGYSVSSNLITSSVVFYVFFKKQSKVLHVNSFAPITPRYTLIPLIYIPYFLSRKTSQFSKIFWSDIGELWVAKIINKFAGKMLVIGPFYVSY